jgi:hypothetical protein
MLLAEVLGSNKKRLRGRLLFVELHGGLVGTLEGRSVNYIETHGGEKFPEGNSLLLIRPVRYIAVFLNSETLLTACPKCTTDSTIKSLRLYPSTHLP